MTKTIIAPDMNPYFNVGAQIGAIEKQIALSQVNESMIIVKIFTALVLCLNQESTNGLNLERFSGPGPAPDR